MPCSNVIARLLLKQGKAKVKRKCPFTIKLTYETTEYTQECTLGVDTGSSCLGASVVDSNSNVLYMSNVKLRNDIKMKLEGRRLNRKNRRSRKTRYRKERFENRRNSIRKNRFFPTMISKINSHVREVEFVKSILPITNLVFETGSFDCHLMKNPMLNNENYRHWGYRKGANYGFENTRVKILDRDNYTCQCCKGRRKDSKLEVHHIVRRSENGSDEEDNLITLCHSCHYDIHHGIVKLKLEGKKKDGLKYATQMNSIRVQLLKIYPEALETFGYITSVNRQNMNLAKEHYNDAVAIASGGNTVTFKTKIVYNKRRIPKGEYKRTRGKRSEILLPAGKMFGFKRCDKVRYFGKEYFIQSRMSTGYAFLMDINGEKVSFSDLPRGYKTPKMSNCKRVSARSGCLIQAIAI